MDEKLIEEISNTTGVPQMLVSRSAQARAEANGVDINSILSSWSSGSPAAPVATEVVEEAPVATEVVEEFIEPPADLFSKVARALQYGSLFGIITGFIQAIAISTYLYDGLILESETLNVITEYKKTTYIVALTLLTTFFAVINTVNVKKLLEANFIGHGIKTSDRESIFQGTGLGLMFGSITGFFITSSIGQTIEPILPEDPTLFLLPVFGSFWRIVLMSTLFQALISVISILLGVPKGLELFEEEEAVIIRNRITGSAVIPLGAILVGGIIAVLISQVFLNFDERRS